LIKKIFMIAYWQQWATEASQHIKLIWFLWTLQSKNLNKTISASAWAQ